MPSPQVSALRSSTSKGRLFIDIPMQTPYGGAASAERWCVKMKEIVDCIKEILGSEGGTEPLVLEATKLNDETALVRLPEGTQVPLRVRGSLNGQYAHLPWFVSAQTYLPLQAIKAMAELNVRERRPILRPLVGSVTVWCDQDGNTIPYAAPSARGWFEADGHVTPPPEGARLRVTFRLKASATET
ncbi:hypothetical protein HY630_02685 [Candidatus Uhrbacteria bacterium]|nr:hypothetical protein [Candidatus Uhrbacteria bacterium]